MKYLYAFLFLFFSFLNYTNAQCSSFDAIIVQDDFCNSNGEIDVVFTHPFTIDVLFPNFTTATYSSTTDTITLSDLFGGNYTITAQGTACSETVALASISVTTSIFSSTFFTNGYNVECYGDCDGQVFLSINNPPELYTIDWYQGSVSGAPFYSSNTSTSNQSSQSNLCAGDYVFVFSSASGCVTTRSYTVREPDSLSIQGIASEVFCNSGASGDVEIDVSGGVGEKINSSTGNVIDILDYSFSWTGPNSYSSVDEDIFNLAIGDYTVTVTDDNGCTAQETFNLQCLNDNIDYFYYEDFESVTTPALPADMNTSSLESNYFVPSLGSNVQVDGFYTGNSQDAGVGGYWNYIADHTTFAMTNDDSCLPGGVTPNEANNCDLSFEVLELPELDFTGQANMWLTFEFFHDKNWGGGDASVEVSVDGGDSWEDISGPLAETQAWQAAAFDLSAYEDFSSVTIRFIWSDNSSWASGFAIDDIVVNPIPDYAIKLNQALQLFPSTYFGGTTYKIAPLAQAEATGYNFAGYIQNMGLNTLDSARVFASISSEGFSTQSDGNNTVSLDQDSLYCNDIFTATSTGTYTADIYAADENGAQSETTSVSFEVAEYDYARDGAGMSGDYTGGSYINNEGSEQRGNVFDIYADATLYAIKVRAHPATSPNCMAKGILNTVIPGDGTLGNPTTYAFYTETSEITIGEHTDGWTNLMLDPPVQLFAGDIVLATIFAEYNGVDTLIIGTSGNTDVSESMLQDIDGTQTGGNSGDWYYTTSAPMVRLNFDPNATGPTSPSYICIAGSCIDPLNGSGTYSSYEECANNCNTLSSDCSELFFSEYVEGSSNNKAIEIYNPTDAPIDLGSYTIGRYSNGSSVVSDEMTLSGILNPGQTWVVTNSDTNSTNEFGYIQMELYNMADQWAPAFPSPLYMNGNDAITLSKYGTIIDIIGKIGEDPGDAWTDDASAGFTDANGGAWWTKNHTMVRKSNITQGVTSNPLIFVPSNEWDTLSINDWSNIGFHECDCNLEGCTDPIALNYNSDATFDDGSCLYCDEITTNIITTPATSLDDCNGVAIVETTGGQDPYLYYWNGIQSSNISYLCSGYNILTTYDSNDCVQSDTIFIGPENYGCMDSFACNYDITANIQDNSCIYPFANLDCDFNCLNDFDLDGICDEDEVFGCTDSNSPNFNAQATEDDGSCIICNLEIEYISSNSTNQVSCDGIIGVIVNNTIYDYTVYVNSSPLISNYNLNSCYGENVIFVEDEQGCTVSDIFFLNSDEISGCTDQSALNYNDDANSDDGSCEYEEVENPCDIVPTGLLVDDIIHNKVVFNWSVPSAAPSHYMIRYRVVGTSSWTVMSAGPVNSNDFTGNSRTRYFMQPGTTYEWNIRARVLNEDGSTNCQSPWSASSQFTTLPACPNLDNLSVYTEANWVNLNADAPSEEWGVWQSKAKMKEVGTNAFRYANGDSDGNINVLKGNFNPNTQYQWHTKAWCTGNVDEDGNSDPQYHSGWGEFSSFTTEEICDKMPVNLSTSSNGANTAITMSWDLPLSGTPDHYFLELNNDNTGQQWQWNNISGNQTSKTKFNLSSGDYSWRIRGACGANGTSWATIFSEPVYYSLGGARLDNDIVSDLNVYPNPSRDVFNISFSSDNLQSISIRVVNVIGEEVYNEELIDFDGTYTHELDMSKNSKGVYFLEINSEKGTLNSKMVLQ